MSKKLNSARANLIYEKIEREKARIRDSKSEISDSMSEAKASFGQAAKHPLSLINTQGFNSAQISQRAVLNHPISVTLGMLAAGWGFGYLLKNKKRSLALAVAAPLGKIATESLNSRFAKRVISEINSTAESMASEIFSKLKNSIMGVLSPDDKNNTSNLFPDNKLRWEEAPPSRSNKTYYTH